MNIPSIFDPASQYNLDRSCTAEHFILYVRFLLSLPAAYFYIPFASLIRVRPNLLELFFPCWKPLNIISDIEVLMSKI